MSVKTKKDSSSKEETIQCDIDSNVSTCKCHFCKGPYYTENFAKKTWWCFSCGRHGKIISNQDDNSSNVENLQSQN